MATTTSGITRHRDLRTGRSPWAGTQLHEVPVSPLLGDTCADVAVVGGGISGALTALTLARRGFRTVILDRRLPGHGSTMASTALLQFEIDVPLIELAERIGYARARRAWRRSVRGVRALTRLVTNERISCGYAKRQSLYLAGDQYGARALAREAAVRAQAGIPGHFIGPSTLARRFGIERTGAIVSPGSAVANPMQLTTGILRRAMACGVRIYAPADVRDLAVERSGVRLYTHAGATVHATNAVFCTGYEFPKVLTLSGQQVRSTWAIATRPAAGVPTWLANTVVWEASDPYLYLRTSPDGAVIAGGEDEASSSRHARLSVLHRKAQQICRKVEQLLAMETLPLSHAWGGAFGTSSTGLPVIDRLADWPHCHVVAGFGGNGITYSMIAAEVTAARLTGRDDPDAALYRAPR